MDPNDEAVLHTHPLPGKVLQANIIEARGYTAVTLSPGQVLRFVDIEGQQVPDLVCFREGDPDEWLHLANSMNLNGHLKLQQGDGLYSVICEQMMTIVAYSNEHSFAYGSMCSEELNRVRYRKANTPNCRDNLAAALEPWGIDRRRIPNAFVPFMRVELDPDLTVRIEEPTTQPGDFYDLRAEMPLVVSISNCPQEDNPCNGYRPTKIGVIVYEAAR